jgi:hypothetical protein
MAETQTTEPQGPSLDDAASRIAAKLSGSAGTQPTATTQPEQPPEREAEQAPPAPVDETASEAETQDESDDAEPQQPPKYTAKVDGQEVEVTLDDLLKSYSFTEHNTRKSQQVAAEKAALEQERKAFQESEVAAVRAERQQYATYLEQLATALKDSKPVEPDWTALRATLPADEFAAELLAWQQNAKRIEQVNAERAKVQAQQDADAQAGFTKYVQEQHEQLAQAIPEWTDPEKGVALKKELKTFGMDRYGFSEDEFAQVTDARLVRLLYDGMQYQKAQAKAPEIKNKIELAMDTSAPGSRTTAPKRDDLRAAQNRLRESGSIDDAADAIGLRLKRSGTR